MGTCHSERANCTSFPFVISQSVPIQMLGLLPLPISRGILQFSHTSLGTEAWVSTIINLQAQLSAGTFESL